MSEKVIEVKNLTKKYKELTAVDDLSFDVKKGEILGLLGPNGSGKSTTINCILSLLSFNSGKIKILGKEMNPDALDIKREIGVIFQDVAVFEELSVWENVNYFCSLYIKDRETCKKYTDEAIGLVGLEDFKKFAPKKLSGGLLRRLNIACGIAHKPKIIFLDEPTVAVDPQSRNNILEGIKKLRDDGATIVYTTHYMEEAEILCDRIVILDRGKIIAEGTKDSLKDLAKIKEKITIEIDDIPKELEAEIEKLNSVIGVKINSDNIVINYDDTKKNLAELVTLLEKNKVVYEKIYSERPTLNDVFLELTGKDLRD